MGRERAKSSPCFYQLTAKTQRRKCLTQVTARTTHFAPGVLSHHPVGLGAQYSPVEAETEGSHELVSLRVGRRYSYRPRADRLRGAAPCTQRARVPMYPTQSDSRPSSRLGALKASSENFRQKQQAKAFSGGNTLSQKLKEGHCGWDTRHDD